MRSPSAVALALTLALLLATSLVGGTSLAASNASTEAAPSEQVIVIDLAADGNATWTIHHRVPIDSEDEIDDFREYAEALQRGDRAMDYDEETFQYHADRAAGETGREMRIGGLDWSEPTVEPVNESADDPDAWIGTLSVSFTWTNFARTTDDELHLGDVFVVDDQRLLSGLTDDQRLEIRLPRDHAVDNSSRPITDGALVWSGPHEFEPGEIYATLERDADSGSDENGTGGAGSGGSGDGDGLPPGNGDGSFLGDASSAVFAGVGVVTLVVLAGYLVVRRPDLEESPDEDEPEPADDPPPEAPAAASESATETTVEFDEDVDVELLSDEERVLRLLRRNGGRMKQASIVSETDWSNAKVSQLLSRMDEDDEIDKLRIGRENLITLPDVDPTEID